MNFQEVRDKFAINESDEEGDKPEVNVPSCKEFCTAFKTLKTGPIYLSKSLEFDMIERLEKCLSQITLSAKRQATLHSFVMKK